MKYLRFLMFAIVFNNCTPRLLTASDYECSVKRSEFGYLNYITSEDEKREYDNFCENVHEGVFFTTRNFMSEKSSKVCVLDMRNSKFVITRNSISKLVSMNNAELTVLKLHLVNCEIGSFRQICLAAPSEGAVSLLLIKKNDSIITKFDSKLDPIEFLNDNNTGNVENIYGILKTISNF
jgi:hypothetical protein